MAVQKMQVVVQKSATLCKILVSQQSLNCEGRSKPTDQPTQRVCPGVAPPTRGISLVPLMADNHEARLAQAPVIPVYALHAPTIFYEWAPAFGFTNGVVNLTLAANRTWIGQDGAVVNEQVVVAHLRGNVQAALSLRDSLDKALLLAASTPEGKPT